MSRKGGYRLSVVLLLCCSALVHAQISGIIRGVASDGTTKEALIGAVVYNVSDKGHGVVTDINGNYQLSLSPGKDTVVCTMISFQPDTFVVVVTASQNYDHNFLLKSGAQQIETLVVSAGRYERKLEEITVSW